MDKDNFTTIIVADYMYLIVLGDDKTIQKLINILNSDSNSNNMSKPFFIMHNIDKPCAELLDDELLQQLIINEAKNNIFKNTKSNNISENDIDIHKKYIVFDEGVETAQCLAYADISSNDLFNMNKNKSYMIIQIIDNTTYYKISFPILQLDEEINPDELISSWIVENNLTSVLKDITIKPVNIVGTYHDILVFVAHINA